jgi:hypothetical protein
MSPLSTLLDARKGDLEKRIRKYAQAAHLQIERISVDKLSLADTYAPIITSHGQLYPLDVLSGRDFVSSSAAELDSLAKAIVQQLKHLTALDARAREALALPRHRWKWRVGTGLPRAALVNFSERRRPGALFQARGSPLPHLQREPTYL